MDDFNPCPATGADCLTCDRFCHLNGRPTHAEAARMVASMNDNALAAFRAVVPLIGTDSNALLAALVEAACVTALAAGCEPDDFARAVKAIWDDRAREFSGIPEPRGRA